MMIITLTITINTTTSTISSNTAAASIIITGIASMIAYANFIAFPAPDPNPSNEPLEKSDIFDIEFSPKCFKYTNPNLYEYCGSGIIGQCTVHIGANDRKNYCEIES